MLQLYTAAVFINQVGVPNNTLITTASHERTGRHDKAIKWFTV